MDLHESCKDVSNAMLRRRARASTDSNSAVHDQATSSRAQSSSRNTDEESSGDFFLAQASAANSERELKVNGVIKSSSGHGVIEPGGHRSKILNRRHKAMTGTSIAHRSQSTPRKESETQTKTTGISTSYVPHPSSIRSISLPR